MEAIGRLQLRRQKEIPVMVSTTTLVTHPVSLQTTHSPTTIEDPVSAQPEKTTYSTETVEPRHRVSEKLITSQATITMVGFILAAFFLAILIVFVIFYFVQRKRKSLVKNQNMPSVTVAIQDREVAKKESSVKNVNGFEYEDITPDLSIPVTHTDVKGKVPGCVNVAESNVASDAYMVLHNLNEDEKHHVYTELV